MKMKTPQLLAAALVAASLALTAFAQTPEASYDKSWRQPDIEKVK
jgi:hypothetical protein